jgi:hypothetical protein
MTSSRLIRSYDFLWFSLALLIVLALSFLLPVTPQDYWWYLRVGHETIQGGAVPAVDTYSFTRAGTELVYPAWLAAVLLWLAYQAGGITLTVLLRGLLMGVAYGLVWAALRRISGPKLATLLTIVLTLSSSSNWSIRPQVFAIPLFACALLILRTGRDGNSKAFWWLPVISMLWANIHSSFVLVFILGLSALIFGKGKRRPFFLALLLSALTVMINPVGYHIWGTVAEAGSIRAISTEWLPPANTGWQMNIFFGWLLFFIPLAVFSPRKLPVLQWIWFLGLGWLALSGVRFVIWFQFLLALQTAFLLSDWGTRWLDRRLGVGIPAMNILVGALLLSLPLAVLPGIRERWWAYSPPILEDTPVAAVDWLEDHPELPGPMWNDFDFSSYLIFALPEYPTWIDTRMHLVGFPEEQYERYRAIADARYDWQALLDEEGINLLFLSTEKQPNLIQAIDASGNWCTQYEDELAVIASRPVAGETCPK